eukprot:gene9557-biopygen16732
MKLTRGRSQVRLTGGAGPGVSGLPKSSTVLNSTVPRSAARRQRCRQDDEDHDTAAADGLDR